MAAVIPVVEVDVTPAMEALLNFQRAAERMPKLTATALKRTTKAVKKKYLTPLSTEPGPPDYPIQWASLRQKIYVIAMLRAQGNLPYERSHDLSTGWQILDNFKDFDGSLLLVNDVPYVVYVQEAQAQPFHVNRWTQKDDVIAEVGPVAAEMYLQAGLTVWDDFAGVRG